MFVTVKQRFALINNLFLVGRVTTHNYAQNLSYKANIIEVCKLKHPSHVSIILVHSMPVTFLLSIRTNNFYSNFSISDCESIIVIALAVALKKAKRRQRNVWVKTWLEKCLGHGHIELLRSPV